MTRTLSDDMREEREDLKEAAEQTLNIIVDMDLEGRIKWVSPSWKQVVGSSPESVEGHMISEILLGNKDVFRESIESMKQDDSRSRFIRFAVQMGSDSVLKFAPEPSPVAKETSATDAEGVDDSHPEDEQNRNVLNMEGQGIMVYDRTDDEAGHVSQSERLSCWITDSFPITDYVDAATLDRAKRSHNRSAAPARRVFGGWSRGIGKLPDRTSGRSSNRTRPCQTSCADTRSLSHL
jgi:PAS domain S-box-containing protein